MSHEAHTGTANSINHTRVSFSSSFWLIIILVGLFIGALNFIKAMSGGEGHSAGGHNQEQKMEQKHEQHHNERPEEGTDAHPVPEHN